MRFWELVSFCREEPELLERLHGHSEWAEFLDWSKNYAALVASQDRAKLDRELPDDLTRHVLAGSGIRYELSGGYVRVARPGVSGSEHSALEIFNMFGGSFLEEVNEAGLAPVPTDH